MFLAKSLALTGILGLALAAPAKANAPTSLHLTARTTEAHAVGAHPRLGDTQIGSGVLVDRYRRPVGTFAFQCVWVGLHVGFAREACSGWGALGDGQLLVAGMSRSDSDQHTWAVVGGTGAYRGARGEVRLNDLDPRTSTVDVQLVGVS